MRVRIRANGSRAGGKVAVLAEPLSHESLVQAAAVKLAHDGSTACARLYLEGGDEVEADALEKDDVVYIAWDGEDYIFTQPAGSVRNVLVEGSGRSILAPASAPAPSGSKPFAAFISHAKAEAAMEARFVQKELEERLNQPVFIDSDDLHDLTRLKQHVRDSSCLVLIQTQHVLTRPFCLIELLTAIESGVPIIGLCLTGNSVTAKYDYEEAAKFLSRLDSEIADWPRAVSLLAENGWEDLQDAAYLLSNSVPQRISVPLDPGGSAASIASSLDRLRTLLATAEPVVRADMPSQETWLRSRSSKAWGSWKEALSDHRTFLQQWPSIVDAYVGPNALEPSLAEAVMLTINSVNLCSFCSGLHCDLGRMAGLQWPMRLNAAKSAEEAAGLCNDPLHVPGVRYARIFAMYDGSGQKAAAEFDALVAAYGAGRARSVRALCWFLYWGSFVGNTLNGAVGYKTPKPGTRPRFLLQFMAYYGVLFFGVITIVSVMLKALPQVPSLVYRTLGLILCCVGGVFFCALGAIDLLLHG